MHSLGCLIWLLDWGGLGGGVAATHPAGCTARGPTLKLAVTRVTQYSDQDRLGLSRVFAG